MDVVSLPSGREIVIRPITPDDGPELQAAYDRLSPLSKYRRFLAPKPHLSRRETAYLVQVDGQAHVALVAISPKHPGRILGVARFVRLPEEPGTAEFAIVVGDPYQGEGLGAALSQRLALEASARGIRRLRATLLADNAPARGLVQTLPGRVVRDHRAGSVAEIDVELAAPRTPPV